MLSNNPDGTLSNGKLVQGPSEIALQEMVEVERGGVVQYADLQTMYMWHGSDTASMSTTRSAWSVRSAPAPWPQGGPGPGGGGCGGRAYQ